MKCTPPSTRQVDFRAAPPCSILALKRIGPTSYERKITQSYMRLRCMIHVASICPYLYVPKVKGLSNPPAITVHSIFVEKIGLLWTMLLMLLFLQTCLELAT